MFPSLCAHPVPVRFRFSCACIEQRDAARKQARKKQASKEGRDAPRDDAGEAGVRARDDEERAKVLGADADGGDVDREADEAVDEPREHERVPLLEPVGPYCPPQERRRCFFWCRGA